LVIDHVLSGFVARQDFWHTVANPANVIASNANHSRIIMEQSGALFDKDAAEA
jgi:hypothetical protein